MRIVGGKFAGRNLTSPLDYRVRPTAEHVRAAVMEMLGDEVKDARLIDLFAGTGALGLEAISRGARTCDFVETRPSSLHALKANIGLFRLKDATRVFKKDAVPFATTLEEGRYDIAFADPPYGSRMLDRVLESWRERRFARLFVAEHAATHALPKGADRRLLEDTIVTLYRA